MKQYLDLLKAIKEKGTYKPAARPGMPGTQSLFGYQFRHDLKDGFPIVTTKEVSFKNIVNELIWFLRGDTNIKFLVDRSCNIWNEDAYNYYGKQCKNDHPIFTFSEFIQEIKNGGGNPVALPKHYTLGDCGHQYGRVWRDWSKFIGNDGNALYFDKIDQIKNLIIGLKKNPESRRHIVTAIDPAHDQDLALYWCHAMFQFNCRPISEEQRVLTLQNKVLKDEFNYDVLKIKLEEYNIPKYYLDCQLYQRSADVVLGVPYNIASYALLTEIVAKVCNMVPGEFIHTFGDVHIYDNHKEAVETQLSRIPKELPKLLYKDEFHLLCENINHLDITPEESAEWLLESVESWESDLFLLEGYDPDPKIKAKLSTGKV